MTRVVRKSMNHGISLSANQEASNPRSMASAPEAAVKGVRLNRIDLNSGSVNSVAREAEYTY